MLIPFFCRSTSTRQLLQCLLATLRRSWSGDGSQAWWQPHPVFLLSVLPVGFSADVPWPQLMASSTRTQLFWPLTCVSTSMYPSYFSFLLLSPGKFPHPRGDVGAEEVRWPFFDTSFRHHPHSGLWFILDAACSRPCFIVRLYFRASSCSTTIPCTVSPELTTGSVCPSPAKSERT